MDFPSDLDTSSESDYESSQGSTPSSDYDEDEPYENLEPELSEPITEEYNDHPWNPQAQLHNDIKGSAQLPTPTYLKLQRS